MRYTGSILLACGLLALSLLIACAAPGTQRAGELKSSTPVHSTARQIRTDQYTVRVRSSERGDRFDVFNLHGLLVDEGIGPRELAVMYPEIFSRYLGVGPTQKDEEETSQP